MSSSMRPNSDNAVTRRILIERSGLAVVSQLLGATVHAETHSDSGANAILPEGVKAEWDLKLAHTERTPTRERICLNGLWRWQPAREDTVPTGGWGYFKAPGSWPGITDYMQKDCQTVFPHPDWKADRLGEVTSAWYQREITVPATWTGRHIAVASEYLNSLATVYLDGTKIGEMRFPGGEVDLTAACRPGATHLLSMLVTAAPLAAVMLSYTDTASARKVKGTVPRRGLCGDVILVSRPQTANVVDVRVETSVSAGEITFDTVLAGLATGTSYSLRARIRDGNRVVGDLTSHAFQAGDLHEGRVAFTKKWRAERLWDVNTPQNTYTAQIDLFEVGDKLLDTAWPARFGYREFKILGRDFYLNGTRIFLFAVPLHSAQVGAAWASYSGAREALERLKSFGVNFVYTHNYDCEPGSHLSFTEILRAADDVGMLVALSQPHFSHYDWRSTDADRNNGYREHAAFYVRVAQSHASVVAYAMSHNATSAVEDINPDLIDGTTDLRPSWGRNNERLALRAEAIVKSFDSRRIVYHHSSGNLGSMFTANFYVNFVPRQELSDWFEHWSTQGVKPAFLCEYGVPCSWDWTMYRGWYKGKREWGSAVVPWEYCVAEWNAQFFGDRAYSISDRERANLRWEAAQFRAGRVWYRWDYPTQVSSDPFDGCSQVMADYITDNFRAFRTWGVSAFNAWEYVMYWQLRPGVDRGRKALPVDWERLQRPGFSADYLEDRPDGMELAYDRTDWLPKADAEALIRNNGPVLAYLGGKPARFTGKDHNFLPGETVEKQLILINNSRLPVSCDCSWSIGLQRPATGSKKVEISTGEQARLPLRFTLPAGLAAGRYELTATVRFSTGEIQRDSFAVDVLPPPPSVRTEARIALFDPHGETARVLTGMGVRHKIVDATTDFSAFDLLIIGKRALTREGSGPDISHRVRAGLKVLVLEQTAEVLEQRLGFRVAEYGLRQIFPRLGDHPALTGLTEERLRDWRGEATISASRLKYTVGQRYAPEVKWCGIDVTRAWRCGCRGNVASVLIEKPARGDFMPILDGGYSLQYSPLLEYREGNGMVLFCQMDVTGRTEGDPAADRLARNIVRYVTGAGSDSPTLRRRMPGEGPDSPSLQRRGLGGDSGSPLIYVGDPAGRAHLEAAGFAPGTYENGKLPADALLIVSEGGGQQLAGRQVAVREWLQAGGRLLAIGLDEAEANAFLPAKVQMNRAEHIATTFDVPAAGSWRAGVAPADVHNRDPREIPLVMGGADVVGNGVLARSRDGHVIFSQLAPWQFDPKGQMNLKRTFRRVSCLTTRLAANLGAPTSTPLLARFASPVNSGATEQRWLDGLYLDTPEEWDDPYRFFGW